MSTFLDCYTATLSANEGWVDLNEKDFESDDFVVINHAQRQVNNEAPQRMLEIEIEPQQEEDDLVEVQGVSYSRKLVNEMNNDVLFTAEQLNRVTEDEKNSVAELISREKTVEERESFTTKQLERRRNHELKIGSRSSTIKAQLTRLGIYFSGDGDFNRMFIELIGGSTDKTTMAVENQLLTALETGDLNTIKAFAVQVRDELSKMPTDLESYKTMDYESLRRIGYMGFMFDTLRKARVLFPENESDAILDKIAGAKAEIAAGLRRIIDTQVVNLGRSHERFDIDLTLYLQSSKRKQEYKEGSIKMGISQCLGSGIATLRDLQAQLGDNEEQWNRYGKYFESQEYTSNRDARLKPVGEVNVEELSGQLTDYMEQERRQKLSFFNRKLERLSNKQGQSERFYALCNLCKEADAADKNLPQLEKEKFFDRLVIELSKYIESTGNSENKLEAVLLRQDLLRYMKENGVLPIKYELNIAAKNKTINANEAPKLDKYERSVLDQLIINNSEIGTMIKSLVPDFEKIYLRVATLAKYEKSRAFKELYANKAYLIEELDRFFEAKEMDVEGMSMREKYSQQREMRMEDLAHLEDQCTEYLDDCEDESKREIVTAYKQKVNELYRKFYDQAIGEREILAQREARRAAQAADQENG